MSMPPPPGPPPSGPPGWTPPPSPPSSAPNPWSPMPPGGRGGPPSWTPGPYGGPPSGRPGGPSTALVVAIALVGILVVAGVAVGIVVAVRHGSSSSHPSATGGGSTGAGVSTPPTSPTSPTSGSPSGSTEGPTGTGTPRVGQCHHLTAADVAPQRNSSPVVPCDGTATSQTIYVGTVDSPDPTVVTAAAEKSCYGALATALGTRPELLTESTAQFVFYQPTATQYAAGARWFRCDAVLLDGKRPTPLPADLKKTYAQGFPDSKHVSCLDAQRERIACEGAYRPIYSYDGFVDLSGDAKQPADATMIAQAQHHCDGATKGDLFATWPPVTAWDDGGQRYVTCWLK